MAYFEDGDILLSDFDGVFLDSQRRFNEVMKEEKALDKWMDFLNGINWKTFLKECDLVPGALETFTELQKIQILRGIITRIHSFEEGKEKSLLLRDMGIYVPIYYVLPEQPKNIVYVPNKHVILLDDDEKNCIDWELSNGKSILFSSSEPEKVKKHVKRLDCLLK